MRMLSTSMLLQCPLASRRLLWNIRYLPGQPKRWNSNATPPDNVDAILSKPGWSVKSLLPSSQSAPDATASVSPAQLHHLLRLSALPQPKSQVEEESMLQTLASQIHFVQEIQQVDTTGVTPLRSIRDESEAAERENTINRSDLQSVLERETYVGRTRRIRRERGKKVENPDGDAWDGNAIGSANKTMDGYFVVQSTTD